MTGSIHASCVIIDEAAVLILGRSGSGKSRLARRLADLVRAGLRHAILVGDDRVELSARGGRLLARGHPAIAGRAEIREIGIVETPHEPTGVVTLVVELGAVDVPRLPPDEGDSLLLEGVRVPLLRLGPQHPAEDAARLVLARLRR